MLRRLSQTAVTMLLLVTAAGSPAVAATSAPHSPVTVNAGGYVRGGDPIRSVGGYRCTVTFTVHRADFRGFLTAGYCAQNGRPIQTPTGEVLGYVVASSYPNAGYGLVQLNPEWIPLGVVRTGSSTYAPVRGSVEAAIGAQVCRYGSTTGTRCGTLQAKNQTVNYPEGVVHGLTRTNACAEPGDGSGPFFAGNQAQGLTMGGSGNCTSGGTTYFMPVNPFLTAYGLRVLTS